MPALLVPLVLCLSHDSSKGALQISFQSAALFCEGFACCSVLGYSRHRFIYVLQVVRIFSLDNIAIHRRFLKDGKSTLTLSADKVRERSANELLMTIDVQLSTIAGTAALIQLSP